MTHHRSPLPGFPLCLLGALSLLAPTARSQDVLWTSTEPATVTAIVGDLNGDGFREVLAGLDNGRDTRITSGADGSELFSVPGNSAVTGLGDVDGDGIEDFATSETDGGRGGTYYVYSGVDGALLANHTESQKNYGSVLASVGDLDGDGVRELIVGGGQDGSWRNGIRIPYTWVISGAPLAVGAHVVLWTFDDGHRGAEAGDVNNDGIPDIIIGNATATASNCKFRKGELGSGWIRVRSGLDGSLLHEMIRGTSCYCLTSDYYYCTKPHFGWTVGAAGDVNQDGFDDFFAGAPLVALCGRYSDCGEVTVYSGADGSVLLHIDERSQYIDAGVGEVVVPLGDIDHDGFDDIGLLGPNNAFDAPLYPFSYYSGFDGSLMYQLDTHDSDSDASTGDLDGDGRVDVITSQPLSGPSALVAYRTTPLVHHASEASQTVTLRTSGGEPFSTCLTYLVENAGTPLSILLDAGTFDALGRRTLTYSVSPHFRGSLAFKSYGFERGGDVAASNRATLVR